MTLKEWNSLPHNKRRQIVNTYYHNMSEDFRADMAKEFHHNFDWDGEPDNHQTGGWYKWMLKSCKFDKNGRIKITITI